MTRALAPSLGYWMNLPDGWIPLDLSTGRIPDQVARLVAERAAADPAVAAHRGAVEAQLTSALRVARAKELSFAAILATYTRTGLPIAASLALTKHAAPRGSDASAILSELGQQSGKTNRLIELAFIGSVVRSNYLDRTPADLGHGRTGVAEVAVVQYYLPTPDGRSVVVATGATPTLPLTDMFAELFDAILSTFQFVDETVSVAVTAED